MQVCLNHLVCEEKENKKEREQEVSQGRVNDIAEKKLMQA